MNHSPAVLMVMAGGTGGHIFPGLAVAKVAQQAGWRVVWLGNPDGMEARLVPAHGFEMAPLRFAALRGKGIVRKLLLPLNLLRAFWQALRVLRQVKPNIVIGMGGYMTFPGGMMASLLGIPLVIHEQNAVAGLANKVLAHVADCVITGFPGVFKQGRYLGNPVREEIIALPPPAERFAKHEGPLHLLVVGGSLGAAALNEVVPAGLALLTEEERPEVLHQAGKNHLEQLKESYRNLGVTAKVTAFIDDIPNAYSWADLVICRSGALTVAELAAAGIASVLVPFPHAVDDHQRINAQFLVDAGAAILIKQDELSEQDIVRACKTPRAHLLKMAENARALACPHATEQVAKSCMERAKGLR